MSIFQDGLSAYKHVILLLSTLAVTMTSFLLLALLRLAQILPTPTSADAKDAQAIHRPPPSSSNPTHLLIILGSGGHTAEMLNILSSIPDLAQTFTRRTYVVSSGDPFSASKAAEFEKAHALQKEDSPNAYEIVTVRRARRVHQSFWSTPLTALMSLWDCLAVLRGSHPDQEKYEQHLYPDLILTNGPGTGVCIVVAALILRFFGFSGPHVSTDKNVQVYPSAGQMRTVFIESWARVKTLSLSGKILRPLVNKFVVQWPQLAEIQGPGVEYVGPLVS